MIDYAIKLTNSKSAKKTLTCEMHKHRFCNLTFWETSKVEFQLPGIGVIATAPTAMLRFVLIYDAFILLVSENLD